MTLNIIIINYVSATYHYNVSFVAINTFLVVITRCLHVALNE